jgi:hypothetical protein
MLLALNEKLEIPWLCRVLEIGHLQDKAKGPAPGAGTAKNGKDFSGHSPKNFRKMSMRACNREVTQSCQ